MGLFILKKQVAKKSRNCLDEGMRLREGLFSKASELINDGIALNQGFAVSGLH